MNNYLEEISSIVKLPFNEICKDVKVIFIGNKTVYISNYIKILDYNKERLLLKINKTTLEITGSELTISLINKGEIVVTGNINSCNFGEVLNERKSE